MEMPHNDYPLKYAALGIAVLLIVLSSLILRSNRRKLPLPPGPKALPIVGNVFDVPHIKPWIVYGEWAKKYSMI